MYSIAEYPTGLQPSVSFDMKLRRVCRPMGAQLNEPVEDQALHLQRRTDLLLERLNARRTTVVWSTVSRRTAPCSVLERASSRK